MVKSSSATPAQAGSILAMFARPNQARAGQTADGVTGPPPPSGVPAAAAAGADTGPAAAAASAPAVVAAAPPPTEVTEPASASLNPEAPAAGRSNGCEAAPGATANGDTPAAPTAAPPSTAERGPEPLLPPPADVVFQPDTTDSTPTAAGQELMPPPAPATTQLAPGGYNAGHVRAQQNLSFAPRGVTASEVAPSMAAPDARALTADNESISAADYRTMSTYISQQERDRQAFVQDLAGERTRHDAEDLADARTAAADQLADRRSHSQHTAYARAVAAEAEARSAAAADQRLSADHRFAEDARRTADEL